MDKEEQPVKIIRLAAIYRFINLYNGHNGYDFGSLASKQKSQRLIICLLKVSRKGFEPFYFGGAWSNRAGWALFQVEGGGGGGCSTSSIEGRRQTLEQQDCIL